MRIPKTLSYMIIMVVLCTTYNSRTTHAFTAYPEQKTSLRSFDGGASVMLLAFDAVKKSSFMEDRTIMHFNIKQLSGTLLSASIEIALNDIDPDLAEGAIGVYAFHGDGVVSTDEWDSGSFLHEFTGILDGRQILSLDISDILQSALEDGYEYLSFALRIQSGTDRYWLDQANNVPETYISFTITNTTIARAVAEGYIHSYIYTWDGFEYVPIHVSDQESEIQPWQGFWAILPNHSPIAGIDLLIPAMNDPPVPVPPLNLVQGFHYLIAPPLQTDPADLNASSFGQQIGYNLYEDTWRISKWRWNAGAYQVYRGPDPDYDEFMSLQPGQGMWAQLLDGPPLTILLEGEKTVPPFGYYPISLPKATLDTPYTYHMTGNPYWYPIKWSECMVYAPLSDSSDAHESDISGEDGSLWEIILTLVAPDGSARDTHNRIGIIEGDNADGLKAFDIEPPGDYIRLALLDPSDKDSTRYAYDYIPKIDSANERYTWTIELSSTYPAKDTFLTFENIEQVPDIYTVTLENVETGKSRTIHENSSIHVPLYGTTRLIYTLTVSVPVIGTREEGPSKFGIIGVSPNPFNPSTVISFSVDQPGVAHVNVYNIGGQLVESLLNDHITEGMHSIVWNASDQATGVYFVRIDANNKSDVSKILFIK